MPGDWWDACCMRGACDGGRGGTVLLLGGVPVGELLVVWWNFVARTPGGVVAVLAVLEADGLGTVGGAGRAAGGGGAGCQPTASGATVMAAGAAAAGGISRQSRPKHGRNRGVGVEVGF
jgi:hypothetical protein